MLIKGGYQIARYAEIPWEDRKNVDGWPSRAGMYCNDEENSLCMRLIDYPKGSTEPRHVHAGMHATTVLKGSAIVDGLTLGPARRRSSVPATSRTAPCTTRRAASSSARSWEAFSTAKSSIWEPKSIIA